jgi:hypothetical protein
MRKGKPTLDRQIKIWIIQKATDTTTESEREASWAAMVLQRQSISAEDADAIATTTKISTNTSVTTITVIPNIVAEDATDPAILLHIDVQVHQIA